MRFVSLFGLLVFIGIAFLMSNNKSKIRPRIIIWGLGLQLLFASIILGNPILIIRHMERDTFCFIFRNVFVALFDTNVRIQGRDKSKI
ncbi:MAG: hypothetical protein IIA58_06180 [Candidatus Marinimicrobia bacterium]|nr:hypothetical protein [Candidatus Neomarinimicrobiota bacterium]